MDPSTARGFAVTSYLLGARGDELLAALPDEVTRQAQPLVQALCSTDRNLRARWLASGLRDLGVELEARSPRL